MIIAEFVVRSWNAWAPGLSSQNDWQQWSAGQKQIGAALPSAPKSVPRMLQRRLSPLAKAVFTAADPCIKPGEQMPTVFSSAHGEISKSFLMLKTMSAAEDISPTTFSLSVHNAISGLFSIVYGNQQESTVLAPGMEGIAPAFIEALGLLQEGHHDVLLVAYDEPLPDFFPYLPFNLNAPFPCALALRITATGPGLALQFCQSAKSHEDGEQPAQLLAFIKFLVAGDKSLRLGNQRNSWIWNRL